MRGNQLKGALAMSPSNRPMQRVSPGVYRNAGGQLVQQTTRQPQPMQQVQRPATQIPASQTLQNIAGSMQGSQMQPYPMNPTIGAVTGAGYGAGMGNMASPTMPQYQPMQPGMMYPGGSPNFNEMAGGYASQVAGMGAGMNMAPTGQGQMQPQVQPQYDIYKQLPGQDLTRKLY